MVEQDVPEMLWVLDQVEVSGPGMKPHDVAIPFPHFHEVPKRVAPHVPNTGIASRLSFLLRFGVVDEWHLDFHKLQPEIGIQR